MSTTPHAETLRPFRVAVPPADIDDLRARLRRTRLPSAETVADWTQGVPRSAVESLVDRWSAEYDWTAFEDRINTWPQFLTAVDGVDIHLIHARSAEPTARALLMTHGWPGSNADFLDLIGPLTDPVRYGGSAPDAFHVVIPTLPGFGFSGKPTDSGWTAERIAQAWTVLIRRLGYTEWFAHGGDWGGVVTTALGRTRPAGLVGIHLNTPYAFPATIPDDLSADERRAVEGLARYGGELGGSNHLQGTKPQTVGTALADSPVGQAAWIYEKYQSKTDNAGRAEDAIPLDTMLDGISVAWFTNSAASSARIYWENRAATMAGPVLDLPTAVSVFPADIPRLPVSWIRDTYRDLVYVREVEHGGHFAALERPDILVRELRDGFRPMR